MMIRATIIAGLIVTATATVRLGAQASPGAPTVTDALRCWWRTGASAVTVGEPFEATVTCAVREGEPVRVVPDESRLQPTSIQLAPFEVLGGSHPADLHSGTHRFFQYHYTVRIIAPDVIGRDARFPDIQLHYRLHDQVGGETVEGRDRVYLLPGQPIRVLSQVPLEADDIRDSSNADFSVVPALRFRARAFRLAAALLAAIGLVVLASVAVGLVRGTRPAAKISRSPVSQRAVLGQAVAELTEIKRQSAGGWTPDLLARAAAAIRVAAATALGYPVAQHRHVQGTVPSPGGLHCTRGWLRKEDYVVSSSITPSQMAQRLEQSPAVQHRGLVEELERSLAIQTRSLYGSASQLDGATLDESLTAAISAAQRLRRTQARPRRWIRSRAFGQSAEAEA